MKKILFTIISFTCLNSWAQNVTIPDKDFNTTLNMENIELKSTDEQKIEVMIVKSRSYLKSNVRMLVSSSLPKGLNVTFSPERGNFDVSEVTITTFDLLPGDYMVIIGTAIQSKQIGAVLRISVR